MVSKIIVTDDLLKAMEDAKNNDSNYVGISEYHTDKLWLDGDFTKQDLKKILDAWND